jgi:tRNA A-37 threonylcarbamoyl transferase component Bud32
MSALRFDCVLDDAHVLARGATATVFYTRVDGAPAVVKRIEDVVDVAHAQWRKNAPAAVNVKRVIDKEVALHAQVSALGVAASPALYGVVRLQAGSIEVDGKQMQRWTYLLFMEHVAGETLREFLWRRRRLLSREDAAALVQALRKTCAAFAAHGVVVGDRMNPSNIIVREKAGGYELVFIDYQNAKKCSDMFTRPAWLICVACASTEHARGADGRTRDVRMRDDCAGKGGTVVQSARRIYAELAKDAAAI